MICVDSLQNWGWKLGPSCHLFCHPEDGVDSLHFFAGKIGLNRRWFQSGPGRMPHYDLTASKRIAAVRLGAKECSRRETVDHLKLWRLESEMNPPVFHRNYLFTWPAETPEGREKEAKGGRNGRDAWITIANRATRQTRAV